MASIKNRNGSYQITVSCGYDIRGKKLIETATFTPEPGLTERKREQAVREFALDFERQVRNGFAMEGRKITLLEFARRWLEQYAKINLQPGSVVKYTQELDQKILPALGHLKLTEIRPHTLNSFYVSLLRDGARMDGKPGGYSTATVRKVHNILSSILRTAVQWEIIDQNPCNKVRVPSAPSTADNIKFLTPQQTVTLLNYVEEPYPVAVPASKRMDRSGKIWTVEAYTAHKTVPLQLRVLFNLAVYTGMRKGELLALTWDDIDTEKDTVNVSKSVYVVRGEPMIKSPKTRTSYRTISIPHFLSLKLQLLRSEQEAYIKSVGDYWQGGNWVFTQDNGKMMSYSTPYHALQDTIRRYNASHPEDPLPLIPFHGLRHTSATLLIAQKQDVKTVSTRLGHAQTSTTMNIYTHALQDTDRQASAALETLLSPAQAQTQPLSTQNDPQ